MRILFLHNNFPGQYARIVKYLEGKPGIEMVAGSLASNQQTSSIRQIGYKPHRAARDETHFALRFTEKAVIQGQSVYQAFMTARKRGWAPDIILAHSGYGDSLFLKDLWPDAKVLSYLEWYYNFRESEAVFLKPESIDDPYLQLAVRMKNTVFLHDLAAMDWGQCPTPYQKSQIPEAFQDRISLLHDGIDTEFFSPAPSATVSIGDKTFRRGDPVISYVSRGMEPMRGFPQFMEAASILLKERPDAHVVVIGEDKIAYSTARTDGRTYLEWALEAFPVDRERFHFLGKQPLAVLRDIFRVSAAHVYLTVPFVLSWSMMEAMSTGALVIGSDTAPVRDIVSDGENGVLVPFFEPRRLAEQLCEALDHPGRFETIRANARALMLERFDMRDLTKAHFNLIERVANGQPGGI
jgi:glycosyltransferase involved in cell wall biosynthesis